MSDSIRILTTPNDSDKYLKVKIDQDFDFIKILSLNISQDKAYENFCADYGVIVGRVVINSGFGIPNAKVSVFIPIDDDDNQNPLISGLYPYKTVNDKNSKGIRYNLLPENSDSKSDCYTPVGTFPSKREILDNEEMMYVYCKYYKYTTTTNYAGDFMLFGVPLGTYNVHVDADISNIGIASQRPYDLIEQGTPSKFFYSPTKFKDGTNLNSLVQIKSADIGVNVQPFWGDPNNCQIGINRLDIDLNYTIRPAAFFLGSVFGDSHKNSVNKNCIPRKKMGEMCEQMTSQGSLEMIRKTIDGQIEQFDIDGARLIDDDGIWAYQVPMNLDYVVTDEFGNLVPSNDPNKGIPTRARVRFRMSMDEGGGTGRLRTRGKYLVPHNPETESDLDFNFDSTTNDKNFVDFFWNKIYTVKNFISRVDRSGGTSKTSAFVGIKDVDGCVGDKNPFPFNRASTQGNMLFTIICIIINITAIVVASINAILCVSILGVKPFGFISPISLTCPSEPSQSFKPGCGGQSVKSFIQCVAAVLADQLDLFRLDFYNDWVNGTLYFYLLKYKKKKHGVERFCETNCKDFSGGTGFNDCKNMQLTDTTNGDDDGERTFKFRNGVLVQYKDILYYPPIIIGGGQKKLYSTDIFNLGSILDCDWQGFPTIIKYFTDTSYKVPPLIQEVDPLTQEIESGMIRVNQEVGLFFDVDCFGVSFNNVQATNIRRQSEIFVEIPESPTNVGITQININQIYTQTDPQIVQDNSISKYVRDVLYQLNINGPSTNSYPFVDPTILNDPAQGTSFMVFPNDEGRAGGNQHVDGAAYLSYRGYDVPTDDMSFQALGNSYYMYFGTKPGKSAIEKFNAKYNTPCIATTKDDFIINIISTNTTSLISTDGTITYTFIGGTPPFTYTWTGDNFDLGPLTATTGGFINQLPNSTIPYTITAQDALGTIVTRDVIITGPGSLECDFEISAPPTTSGSTDGVVQMLQLAGGLPPYTLNITGPVTQTINNITLTNSLFNNLPEGIYTFTITDSANNTCSTSLTLIAPPPLTAVANAHDPRCSCDGSIDLSIMGGRPPYQVKVTSGSFNLDWTDYSALQLNSLCGDNYSISIRDSLNNLFAVTSVLNGVSTLEVIGNVAGGILTYSAQGGTQPYTFTPTCTDVVCFTDISAGQTITVSVVDKNGCTASRDFNG